MYNEYNEKVHKLLVSLKEFGLNKEYGEYNDVLDDLSTQRLAIWNGWVVGDAAGFSQHCKYRIATDKTIWQMPDLEKGYFLDPGASYFLPRINPKNPAIGLYLALTGHRLRGE